MKTRSTVSQLVRRGGIALALVAALGACSNPTAPRVPTDTDQDPDSDPKNPDGQGLLIGDYEVILA